MQLLQVIIKYVDITQFKNHFQPCLFIYYTSSVEYFKVQDDKSKACKFLPNFCKPLTFLSHWLMIWLLNP